MTGPLRPDDSSTESRRHQGSLLKLSAAGQFDQCVNEHSLIALAMGSNPPLDLSGSASRFGEREATEVIEDDPKVQPATRMRIEDNAGARHAP